MENELLLLESLPDEITVSISGKQEYDRDKYLSDHCYLADILRASGFKHVDVYGAGLTGINGSWYNPSGSTPFAGYILKANMDAGKDTIVTLIKQETDGSFDELD